MRAKWKKKRKGPEENSFMMLDDGKISPPSTPPSHEMTFNRGTHQELASLDCGFYRRPEQVTEGQLRPEEVIVGQNFSHPEPEDNCTPPPMKDPQESDANVSPMNASSGYGSEGSSPECPSQMSPSSASTSCHTPTGPTPRSLLAHWGRYNAFQYSASWQAFAWPGSSMGNAMPSMGGQMDVNMSYPSQTVYPTDMYSDKVFHN